MGTKVRTSLFVVVAALASAEVAALPGTITTSSGEELLHCAVAEHTEWARFCAAMQTLLTDRRPAVLGWTLPAANDIRRATAAPLSLVEIHPQAVATTAKIVFHDIEMSVDGIGRILAAADETIPPKFRTIDLDLPAVFPDECPDKLNGEPDLASIEITRALVLRFTAISRDAYRPHHCPADPNEPHARPPTPALWVRGVTFKQSTRWLLPRVPHLSFAFAASRFEGPVEIAVGAPPASEEVGRPGGGATYIALHTSVLDAHAAISGIAIDEFTAYFNRMQSFELIGVAVTERLRINDNAIGPLRIRSLDQPRELIIDANTLSDSLYVESVRPWTRSSTRPLWLVAHNKIAGNLLFSLIDVVAGSTANGVGMAGERPEFRFLGMKIDGSAYFLVHEDLIKKALRFDLDLTHSTVASRLLVTAAKENESGSAVGATRALAAMTPAALGSACSSAPDGTDAPVRVDLTGSTAGALVWNLPLDVVAGALCVGWSGPSFRPATVDARAVAGPLLVEDATSRGMDWLAQAAHISNWSHAQVAPSPEAYGFTERYFGERGFLFEALSMKGLKTQENLLRKFELAWRELRQASYSGRFLAVVRLLVLSILFIYYLPAWFGAHPELAMLGLLAIWFAAATTYWWYSRHWARSGWDAYARAWRQHGNQRFPSQQPGFEQKDEHPWRKYQHLLYSLDCMVPLVSLGVADEYQPHTRGHAAWRAIAMLPPAQKVAGTWLGSLCLVIFLF